MTLTNYAVVPLQDFARDVEKSPEFKDSCQPQAARAI